MLTNSGTSIHTGIMHGPSISLLQSSALIFFIAINDVIAACWPWLIGFTLKISVDSIPVDRNAAGVLERLQIAANNVPVGDQAARVVFELEITVDACADNPCRATLFNLDAAADS